MILSAREIFSAEGVGDLEPLLLEVEGLLEERATHRRKRAIDATRALERDPRKRRLGGAFDLKAEQPALEFDASKPVPPVQTDPRLTGCACGEEVVQQRALDAPDLLALTPIGLLESIAPPEVNAPADQRRTQGADLVGQANPLQSPPAARGHDDVDRPPAFSRARGGIRPAVEERDPIPPTGQADRRERADEARADDVDEAPVRQHGTRSAARRERRSRASCAPPAPCRGR